jgi:hypothetical protein
MLRCPDYSAAKLRLVVGAFTVDDLLARRAPDGLLARRAPDGIELVIARHRAERVKDMLSAGPAARAKKARQALA